MNKGSIRAFTLVELVVVVTILAILSAIGFVAYSSYLVGSRDTARLSNLNNIHKGLSEYSVANKPPYPDDKLEIQSNGTLIAYQGTIGTNALETINYTNNAKDPLDDNYYSYYITKNRKYFQVLGLYEENELLNKNMSFISHSVNADYSDRFPFVLGKKLGILTNTLNVPIEQLDALQASGSLDIQNTPDTYTAYLRDYEKGTGDGTLLIGLQDTAPVGGKWCRASDTKIECLGAGWTLGGWTLVDPNCDVADIDIYDGSTLVQTWAGCNSTLGNGFEFGQTNEDIGTSNYSGTVSSCYDYYGNVAGCTSGDVTMASNTKANTWFSGTNPYGDTEVANIWGKMYVWTEASSACGTGYHLPSDAEWATLELALGCSAGEATRTSWGCNGLGWLYHSTTNNSSSIAEKLQLPLVGYGHSDNRTFLNRGADGYLWSSTFKDLNSTYYYRRFAASNEKIERSALDYRFGAAVRCIKN